MVDRYFDADDQQVPGVRDMITGEFTELDGEWRREIRIWYAMATASVLLALGVLIGAGWLVLDLVKAVCR